MKIFIIAEAGVNHNNKIKYAKKLVDIAKKSGADAVKFQVFKTENYIKKNAPLANYQKKNSKFKTQFDMIKSLELSEKNLFILINYCKKKKIKFLASPFDLWGVEFLKKNKIPIIKIPSGEINNIPYLEKIGSLKRKVILSTGMSVFEEISIAINILRKNGTKLKDITLLQCNTEYPTKLEHTNLNVLNTFKEKFKVKVGLSDHSNSLVVPCAAVAMGATTIEKHITLSKKLNGPDHKASLEPKELKIMINNINEIVKAMGTKEKKVTLSEKKNIPIARKSILAKVNIKKGERFSKYNLITKRPGNKLSAGKWYELIRKKAKKNYKKDDFI
jgi:N,N'-diacetyllegionaminate synthase